MVWLKVGLVRWMVGVAAVWFILIAYDARAIDLDADGMSDVFEHLYGAQSLQPGDDEDGDGATNLVESIMGTDPFDRDSVLRLNHQFTSDGLELSWHEQPGKSYLLEASYDLVHWDTLEELMFFGGSDVGDPDPEAPDIDLLDGWDPWMPGVDSSYDLTWIFRYYFSPFGEPGEAISPANRAWDADADGDGFLNFLESYAGTDPEDADSRFEIALASSGDHVQLKWYDANGALRYELHTEAQFQSFDATVDPGAFGSAIGDLSAVFSGAVLDDDAAPAQATVPYPGEGMGAAHRRLRAAGSDDTRCHAHSSAADLFRCRGRELSCRVD